MTELAEKAQAGELTADDDFEIDKHWQVGCLISSSLRQISGHKTFNATVRVDLGAFRRGQLLEEADGLFQIALPPRSRDRLLALSPRVAFVPK